MIPNSHVILFYFTSFSRKSITRLLIKAADIMMSTWCIVPRKVGNIEPKVCVHQVLIQEISEVGENLDTILIGIHQSCLKLTDSIDYIKIIGFYLWLHKEDSHLQMAS